MAIKIGGIPVFDTASNAADGVMLKNIDAIGTLLTRHFIAQAPAGGASIRYKRGRLNRYLNNRANISDISEEVGYWIFLTGGNLQLQFNMTSTSTIVLHRWRNGVWTNINTWTAPGAKTQNVTTKNGDHLRLYRQDGSNVTMTYCRICIDADSSPMYINDTDI